MSERTWPAILRIVAVLALGLGILLPALWVVAWLEFAGGRFGWVLTAAAFAALCGAAGWLAVPSRWSVGRRRTAIGLAAVAALLGVATAHAAPPTPGRLRHEIAQIEEPGWHLEHEDVSGNAICFDYCTSVTRRYRVNTPPGDLASRLRPLVRNGSEIDIAIDIAPGPRGTSLVIITAAH